MSQKIKPSNLYEIYKETKGRKIFTKNIFPGITHFAEKTIREKGEEYREIEPKRSKLAATIAKGCPNIGLRKDDVVLYLGASHGYTPSFVSDIVGKKGLVFGVDPAPRVVRDLVFLAEKRKNIIPLLEDANHPENYQDKICQADFVYQDIAQKNQGEIFIKNCLLFLKEKGYGALAIKARSVDVKKKPTLIFKEIRAEIEKHFTIIDYRLLDPYELDHCMIIIKKQK